MISGEMRSRFLKAYLFRFVFILAALGLAFVCLRSFPSLISTQRVSPQRCQPALNQEIRVPKAKDESTKTNVSNQEKLVPKVKDGSITTNISNQEKLVPKVKDGSITTNISTANTTLSPASSSKPTPTAFPEEKLFQVIQKDDAWVYSAFYDHALALQGKPQIRAFGIARFRPKKVKTDIMCHFDLHQLGTTNSSVGSECAKTLGEGDNSWCSLKSEEGKLAEIPEHHGYEYRAFDITCKLPNGFSPKTVSFGYGNQVPKNRLSVIYPKEYSRNFTVCHPVLHSNYNNVNQLVEIVEYNRILGAQKIFVYFTSVGPKVLNVLKHYEHEGLVELLSFPLPVGHDKVHYFGQLAAVQDCLYRNRKESKYIIFSDLDEVIIPKHLQTWSELVTHLDKRDPAHTAKRSDNNEPDLDTKIENHSRRRLLWANVDSGTESLEAREDFLFKEKLDIRHFPPKNVHASHYSHEMRSNQAPANSRDVEFSSNPSKSQRRPLFFFNRRSAGQAGSFCFKSAFFNEDKSGMNKEEMMKWGELKSEEADFALKHHVKSLGLYNRTVFFRFEHRSKVIAVTDRVYTMGIHFVWKHLDAQVLYIKPEVAMVHHYRNGDGYTKEVKRNTVAVRFKDSLIASINRTMNSISDIDLV